MKKVLLAPLDWGLGHATRCVPVIDALLAQGAEVILAGDGSVYSFLQQRYPDLPLVRMPGHRVKYGRTGSLMASMALQLNTFVKSIDDEHLALDKLIREYNLGVVISDNRYGLWHSHIPSFLITHQVCLQAGGLWRITLPFANKYLRKLFSNFKEIWIPDVSGSPGMAGALSHPGILPGNARYIGLLSRFHPSLPNASPEFDFLIWLSGPEPHRTQLENLVCSVFGNPGYKILMLRGMPGAHTAGSYPAGFQVFSHLDDFSFMDFTARSRNIICRSGYSSLMDLIALSREAYLIPTPGQPEQEYLARLHNGRGFYRVPQKTTERFFLFPERIQSQQVLNPSNGININDLRLLAKEICSYL